jgi:glutaredoxin-like protein
MIPLREQQAIRDLFAEELRQPVKIDYFTQRKSALMLPGREECQFCDDVKALLQELTRQSETLSLAIHDLGADRELEKRYGVDRVPATVARGVVNRPVAFFGVPLGELFTSFVQGIILLSHNHSHLPVAAARRVKRLRESVGVRVFVSLNSPYCAAMMLSAFAFAIENKFVKAEVFEVAEFPRLVERYGIKEVPYTVLNDRAGFPGLVEPDVFAEQIVKAATTRTLPARTAALGATTPIAPPQQQGAENVRPSGLIVPGR